MSWLFVGEIGYQPQVEDAVPSADGESVSLSEVAGPDRLLEPGEDPHAHEEQGEDHAEGTQGDEQGEVVVDPHIWFDLDVMADVAVRAGDAEAYRGNAKALRAELGVLATELDEVLGGECSHQEVIVSHQAYGYLFAPHGSC
jgi:zinc transport system substrate-binding protein